jgi:hypothetical protein
MKCGSHWAKVGIKRVKPFGDFLRVRRTLMQFFLRARNPAGAYEGWQHGSPPSVWGCVKRWSRCTKGQIRSMCTTAHKNLWLTPAPQQTRREKNSSLSNMLSSVCTSISHLHAPIEPRSSERSEESLFAACGEIVPACTTRHALSGMN